MVTELIRVEMIEINNKKSHSCDNVIMSVVIGPQPGGARKKILESDKLFFIAVADFEIFEW